MSLSKISKVTEEAVTFQSQYRRLEARASPLNGPIEIQADLLGSDIVMQLDELVSPARDGGSGGRGDAAFGALGRALQGRVRAARNPGAVRHPAGAEHRRRSAASSAERLTENRLRRLPPSAAWRVGEGARGHGRGGWSFAPGMLPAERRARAILMGVGKPIDIVEAVRARRGHVSTCVACRPGPGGHGQAWTWEGSVNLKNARFGRRRHAAGRDQRVGAAQPRLFQGLSAPPGEVRGDPRPGAALLAQTSPSSSS